MSDSGDTTTGTVNYHTLARRFPQMISRVPSGEKIPGGPYTTTQVVVAAVMLFVLFKTLDIWARFGLFVNAALFVTLTWGVVWLVGRSALTARNPISVISGAYAAIAAPATGRLDGRPVRIPRPRDVAALPVPVTIDMSQFPRQASLAAATDTPEPSPAPQPAATAPSPPPPPVSPRPALSPLQQQLLKGTQT